LQSACTPRIWQASDEQEELQFMMLIPLLYLASAVQPPPALAQTSFSQQERALLRTRAVEQPNPTTAVERVAEFYSSILAAGLSGARPDLAADAAKAQSRLEASTDGWLIERTASMLIESGKRGGAPATVRIDWNQFPQLSKAVAYGVKLMLRAQQLGEGGGGVSTRPLPKAHTIGPYACEAPAALDQFYLATVKPSPDRVALLRTALKADPNNVFLNRWLVVTDGLDIRSEYRQLATDHPGDPSFLYDYAQAIMTAGWDPDQALPYLEKSITVAPGFPWSYLLLAHIHSIGKYADQDKLIRDLNALAGLCPQSIELSQLSRVHNSIAHGTLAANYRAAIEGHLSPGTADYYPKLWSSELRVIDSADYHEYARRVAADLVHLRQIGSTDLNAVAVGEALVTALGQ
jgi:hypothetical protein